MSYPKEYAKKAMDLIEREYITKDGVESTALITLAAICIHLVAYNQKDEWEVDEGTAFLMVREAIMKPEKYE